MVQQERNVQFARALVALRSKILRGNYPAGTRLRETAVAEDLDISRTPIRQAMDRLVDEGLLERIETGGCCVASFTPGDLADAIELRGVLEGTAARLAAERGVAEAELDRARKVLNELDAIVADPDRMVFGDYVRCNAEFHDLVTGMSGSGIIVRATRRASRLPFASPSAFLLDQEMFADFRRSLVRAQLQHRDILDAISSREGSRAEALAREHARLAWRSLQYVMTKKPEFAERVPGLALVSDR